MPPLPLAQGDTYAFAAFLKPSPLYERERPFRVCDNRIQPFGYARSTNLEFEQIKLPFWDLRFFDKDQFTLDGNGFTYRTLQTALREIDFENNEMIRKYFVPEVEKLIKAEIPNIDHLHFFDWKLHLSSSYNTDTNSTSLDPNSNLATSANSSGSYRTTPDRNRVHVNQSTPAILHRNEIYAEAQTTSPPPGLGYVSRVRVDHSLRDVMHRIQVYAGLQTERLLQGRVRVLK
jgi:hypothetical protein